MSGRELPTFDKDISQILKDLQDIKKAQLLGGDSWIFYRQTSGNNPDYSMSGMNTNDFKVFRVTFTPTDPEAATTADLQTIDTSNGVSNSMLILPTQGVSHSWDIRHQSLGTGLSMSVRVLVRSTQLGSISVVQIA